MGENQGPDLTPRPTSLDEVKHLAVIRLFSTDRPNYCGLVDIPRSTAYALAAEDKLGVRVIKAGKHYRVPVPALLRYLDVQEQDREVAAK